MAKEGTGVRVIILHNFIGPESYRDDLLELEEEGSEKKREVVFT